MNIGLEVLDTLGMKCPQSVLKVAVKAPDMKPGGIGRLSHLRERCPHLVIFWRNRLGNVYDGLKELVNLLKML